MLETCPVLAFTPDVEAARARFLACYRRGARGFFERIALPEAGGTSEQSAKWMAEMEFVAAIANDEQLEWQHWQAKRQAQEQERRAELERAQQERARGR